jgi:hypothetical protein
MERGKMTNIRSVQISLTVALDLEQVAWLLDVTPEEAERLWDDGELQYELNESVEVADVLDVVEDHFEYGGWQVGSGLR